MGFRNSSLIASPTLGWRAAVVFLAAYVGLDWVSYIAPFHSLNISPWNLAPSLGVLYLLQGGFGGFATLALAALAADLFVRGSGTGFTSVIVLNLTLAGSYALIAEAMRRLLRADTMFATRRSLMLWISIVVTGSMLGSLLYIAAHSILDLLPQGEWYEALAWHWAGDAVGMLVSMPLFWQFRNPEARSNLGKSVVNLETVGYTVAALSGLAVAFGLGAESGWRYFYLLYLPVIWASARQGFGGAVLSVAVMQVGMVIGGELWMRQDFSLLEIQMRVLVLALTGFFIGVVVDEQRRSAERARESIRLAAAGEMAGAIAHELNQPLSAIAAYAASCRLLGSRGEYQRMPPVIESLAAEVTRASTVVRRIRELFSEGGTTLSRFALDSLLQSVVQSYRTSDAGKEMRVDVVDTVPEVVLHADVVQLEILLRNLLANAGDAMRELPVEARRIRIRVESRGGEDMLIRVEDAGPGIGTELAERMFEPFYSTKSSGLGLGLAICREIALAHGGALRAVPGPQGCLELRLPLDN